MKLLTILVDMDDTIEHLLKAWVEYLNERHGTTVKHEDITDWDLTIAFPALTKEQVYAPLVEDELWKRVEPMEKAAEVLQRIMAKGHTVKIVTATAYQTVRSKMENVLFKHFPFFTWKDVIIAQNKQMIKGDILVDDAPHNLENGEYVRVLMNASHNRRYNARANGMYRVNNWDEVECIVDIVSLAEEYASGYGDCWREDPASLIETVCGIQMSDVHRLLLKTISGGK